jgi:UDP-4-amino-4,6-dideoxy-N-acetyl-beta-L-altrosamine transaminase
MTPIPYGKQEITEDDIAVMVRALKSDYLTQGPMVGEFETAFAHRVGAQYAVAVNNATAALHLCAMALGVKPGQRVLCTPNTFIASSNAILYCGGTVEFVDIDNENFCIDLKLLEAKLSKAPRGTYAGVVSVDFAGYPVDLVELRKIADKHGIWIIEDACHAPGAEFRDSSGKWWFSGSGDHADLSVFSFHPVKHIATGEGGMITTNSKAHYEKLKLLRSHGITREQNEMTKPSEGGWYYQMIELGMNFRMPDLLCALGNSQLKRLTPNLERRREIADRYTRGLAGLPLKTPKVSENAKHAYHLYVIRTEKRKALYDYLKTKEIFAQVHYIPVHQQPYYEKTFGKVEMPVCEKYYAEALSLPMYHALTNEQQDRVISEVRNFFEKR